MGNALRGDDAAGLAVARRLAGAELEGDCSRLIDLWDGADDVAVVDAAASGAPAGTIHRFDASAAALPARMLRSSTHSFGVAEAIELARELGRLPACVRVYAIEGSDFAAGARLTPAVERAVTALSDELRAIARDD